MTANRILGLVVVAVVALVVITAVVASTRPEPTYDLTSPEGTVQAYLRAVYDRDHDVAAGFLHPDSGCDAADFADAYVEGSARVLLEDVDVRGDRATVRVEVVVSSGRGLYDTYEYRDRRRFELEQAGEGWVLSDSPWPLYFCERRSD